MSLITMIFINNKAYRFYSVGFEGEVLTLDINDTLCQKQFLVPLWASNIGQIDDQSGNTLRFTSSRMKHL